MATEKLVTLKETLGKEELDAIADVKSRIADSYEKLDSLYGAIEEFEKLPFSHSKPHQTPLEGFDRHKLRGYSKPSIENTKDLIGKTAIPPTGGVYDDTTTSTGMAYQSLKAIDALKNRVESVELAFDSVQGTLDAEYSPPTGWEKIFGSKERKKLGLKYADELKKIQKTHRDGMQKKLDNLENILDNLKDKVEDDFYSHEPNTSTLESYGTVIKAVSNVKNNFLKARHEIVRIVGGRQKEGNWDDGNLAWARYCFGDKYAVFMP